MARAGRVRNAVAHGGFVEPAALETCVDQAARSASQLTLEVLSAMHDGENPSQWLQGLREKYETLVDNVAHDVATVLTA